MRLVLVQIHSEIHCKKRQSLRKFLLLICGGFFRRDSINGGGGVEGGISIAETTVSVSFLMTVGISDDRLDEQFFYSTSKDTLTRAAMVPVLTLIWNIVAAKNLCLIKVKLCIVNIVTTKLCLIEKPIILRLFMSKVPVLYQLVYLTMLLLQRSQASAFQPANHAMSSYGAYEIT